MIPQERSTLCRRALPPPRPAAASSLLPRAVLPLRPCARRASPGFGTHGGPAALAAPESHVWPRSAQELSLLVGKLVVPSPQNGERRRTTPPGVRRAPPARRLAAREGTPFATLVLPHHPQPLCVGFLLWLVSPMFPPSAALGGRGWGGRGRGRGTTRQEREGEKGDGEVYWESLTGSGEAGRRRGRLQGGRGD